MIVYAIQPDSAGQCMAIIDARKCPPGVARTVASCMFSEAVNRAATMPPELRGPSTDSPEAKIPYTAVQLADILPIPFEDYCTHDGKPWVLVQLRHTPPYGKRGWTWDKAVQDGPPPSQQFETTNGNFGHDHSGEVASYVCWAKLDEVMTWPRNEEALLAAKTPGYTGLRACAKDVFAQLDRAKPVAPQYVDIKPAEGALEKFMREAIEKSFLVIQYKCAQREIPVQLSTTDKEKASALWSAQLRAKVAASEAEAKRKDREQVICDDDRWEP